MGQIKSQSINNTVLSYFGAALGFLILYVQPHLISATDIGLLRMLYSFSWLIGIVMPFGISSITLRFFSKIRNDDNGHNGLFLVLFLITTAGSALVGGLIYLLRDYFFSYYKNSPEFLEMFGEALVFSYILALVNVFTVFSSSLLKTSFPVFLTDIFIRLGQIIVILLYHFEFIHRTLFVYSFMSIFVLQLILLIFYLSWLKAISFRIRPSVYQELSLKLIMVFGLIMMLTSFASLAIKYIDQLMVGHFLNVHFVGIYATSVLMCVIMEIPFNSLERIASPKIASAWNSNNKDEVLKIYAMSSRYMFFIGSVLFCLLWASVDLIYSFLPQEYSAGKIAFYVVSFSSLVNLMTGVNSSVIMYSNKYFVASFLLFLLIVITFLFHNLFIPVYGISGAAYATLVGIGVFNISKYFYILFRLKMQPFSSYTLYTLYCLLISLFFIILLPEGLNPWLKCVFGCGFTLLIFAITNIRREIILEVNNVFRRFSLIK